MHLLQHLVQVWPPKYDLGQPLLDLTSNEREADQHQTKTEQQQRFIERIDRRLLAYQDPMENDAKQRERQNCRQQSVGEKPHKRVQ